MGSAFFVRAERDVPGVDFAMDGKALALNESQLSAFCHDAGVPELVIFLSPSVEQQRAALESLGIDDLEPVPEQWFAAEDGLRTIRALRESVSAQPEWFTASGALLSDLARVEEILASLGRAGVRWHFDVDF